MKGFVHKYKDNVNTDEIIPARYLNDSSPAALAAQLQVEAAELDFDALALPLALRRAPGLEEPVCVFKNAEADFSLLAPREQDVRGARHIPAAADEGLAAGVEKLGAQADNAVGELEKLAPQPPLIVRGEPPSPELRAPAQLPSTHDVTPLAEICARRRCLKYSAIAPRRQDGYLQSGRICI